MMPEPVSEPPPRAARETLELQVEDLGRSLEEAELRLERFVEESGIAARPAYRARLVFEELATNALKYGGTDAGPPRVSCTVRLEPGELVLAFRDGGRPFDPTSAAPPPRATSLQETTIGGLGIALVTKVATAIDYRRENEENRITVRLSLGRD